MSLSVILHLVGVVCNSYNTCSRDVFDLYKPRQVRAPECNVYTNQNIIIIALQCYQLICVY